MATTGISICNTALIMIGAEDINSFDDASAEAQVAKSVYEDTKKTLLAYHPWRFSLVQLDLGGELVQDPLFKWQRQYQLPANVLRVINLQENDEYEIYEDKLYTNVNVARLVCQISPAEKDFPSYFTRALQFHLCKIFAMSLQEDVNKMQMFDQAADKETARARNIDAQQQPNIGIPDNNYTFINVRG